jgi:hypothetical protein
MNLLTLSLLAASLADAHMNLASPLPRGHRHLGHVTNIDYSLSSPASAPCQGKPPAPPEQTIHAGTVLRTRYEGGAAHGGGHCQYALSYDHGATWLTIHTIVERCLVGTVEHDVPLPAGLPPSDHAHLAWTWVNRVGNREYYWNCVDVRVASNGTAAGGKELLVVNILGRPVVPEWPENGKDVVGEALLAARKDIRLISVGGGWRAE